MYRTPCLNEDVEFMHLISVPLKPLENTNMAENWEDGAQILKSGYQVIPS